MPLSGLQAKAACSTKMGKPRPILPCAPVTRQQIPRGWLPHEDGFRTIVSQISCLPEYLFQYLYHTPNLPHRQYICDKFMIIYKQVCESLEKTENSKFDERKLGRETVRSWARKKE